MKRLTFESMAFQRASDAWCPVTGRSLGPNIPRVVPGHILASVGNIPIYYRFDNSQGYVRYSNEIGCYDRVGEQTHVFTDELDALELRLAGVPNFVRDDLYPGYTSEEGRPLEVFYVGDFSGETFLVDTLIHGNEPDGVLGTLKAFEILATHPDFAALRDQYTIAFMVCCNPDGYYYGQRGLAIQGPHPSGIDQDINLNRVWPWFWTEFIPTDSESKGDAPITCCSEATAMYLWLQGHIEIGIPTKAVAWALDQHATAGDGARYVSRDRCYRNISYEEREKLAADWTIYRLLKSIQARRVHEDAMPDLWVNMYRSRWRPHWHSWLGTRCPDANGGIPCCSFVGEHNKVPGQVVTTDKETYQSASNYNFDHAIAMALVAQGGVTERRAAVLVEHEVGENQFPNADMNAWSRNTVIGDPAQYRPSWWQPTRATVSRTDYGDTHMESNGKALQLTMDLVVDITDPDYCDDTGGSDIGFQTGENTVAYLLARNSSGDLVIYTWDLGTATTRVLDGTVADSSHLQFRLVTASSTAITVMCLGENSAPVNALFVGYAWNGTSWDESTLVTHTDSLEDAGFARDYVSTNAYIFGGRGNAGSSSKIFNADADAETLTEVGTNLLGSGDYGMGACYCEGGDLDTKYVLIGGTDNGESGLRVRVFENGGPSVTAYYAGAGEFEEGAPGYPPSIQHCAVQYDGVDTVWFYGGEHPSSGDVYSAAWSITWNGSGWDDIVHHPLGAGLSDDGDPEDYAGDEDWIRQFRYWRCLQATDPDTGVTWRYFFGGLERLPDGTDEVDLANRRGLYGHDLSTDLMGRPSDINYGFVRYSVHADISGWDKCVTSWSTRTPTVADSETTTNYIRVTNSTGQAAGAIVSIRRHRTYYMHPPQWWRREHICSDITMAYPDLPEDEIRLYMRCYRHNQSILIDAPMFQTGTLWPSSWSPTGVTRAVEVAAWPVAVDPRWMRVRLCWLPAAPFQCLGDDLKLLDIDDGAGSKIELWAVNSGNDLQREYFRDQVRGAREPYFLINRFVGGVSDGICAIPCYWGGYLRDVGGSRFDSPVEFEIWQHAEHGTGLVVRNGWAEGWTRISDKLATDAFDSSATLTIYGGGWWDEPQTLPLDRAWREKYAKTTFENGALLIGDRDPTSGQVSYRGTFRYTETFTRADDPNLGSNWNIILQTGNGWNIASNKARCEELGYELWTAYPYLRDCSVFADVEAPNGGKVGLFSRLSYRLHSLSIAHGYCGYLHCTGASTANLIIARYYYDAGVQNSSILATQAVTYTASAQVTLEFAVDGDTLTLTMSGAHTGTVSTTDSNHSRPGGFGLFGETPGAGQYVWVDNVYAGVPAGTKLKITD